MHKLAHCILPPPAGGKFRPPGAAAADDFVSVQRFSSRCLLFAAGFALAAGRLSAQDSAGGDWTSDAPGARHKVSLDHLPPPFATKSAGNGPHIIRHPDGATLRVPEGFVVEPYAEGFKNPRKLVTAPNGDIFVS